MAQEFIRVNFRERRTVFIDRCACGMTGQLINVNSGVHEIDLGDPRDYAPSSQRPNVANTSATRPLIVEFR